MSKKILICVNPNHKELMEYIISWCSDNLKLESSNIQLVFAHCLDSDLDFSTITGPEAVYVSDYLIKEDEENMEHFGKDMETLAYRFQEQLKLSVSCRILKGLNEPYEQISKYAEESKVDLLIVGSRDLSFWKRMWSTSFSDSLLHSVHCPVIIIKPKTEDS